MFGRDMLAGVKWLVNIWECRGTLEAFPLSIIDILILGPTYLMTAHAVLDAHYSLYIPTDKVHGVLSKNTANFSIFSINIQSLNSKFDSLLAILSDLDNKIFISMQFVFRKHGFLKTVIRLCLPFQATIWFTTAWAAANIQVSWFISRINFLTG